MDVTVVQRFSRDADVTRHGIRYLLRSDGGAPAPRLREIPFPCLRAVREASPDVVHLNGLSFPSQLAALMLAAPRRTVFAVQNHAGAPDRGLRGVLQRAVTPHADGFLFTASGIAEPWRRRGVLGDKPVFEVVEGSCDFSPLNRDAARADTGIRGSPAVLWVGRLHEKKDPFTALEGFARALERLPGATLTMAFGQAPLLAEVEARRVRSPRLAERIRLVGRIPHAELPAWYSAADLFLTSSPDEGSNYALIEAMACGTIPVVSDIPVHRRIAGEAAEFFTRGNPDSCAEALLRAAARVSPEARTAVRARFEEAASWPAVARQARAAYDVLLAGRRRPA
jgi:glycosyltransferase involved in cell wall biosynthesis